MNEDLWTKIREYVRQEWEKRGQKEPVSSKEISEYLGINQEDLFEELSDRVDTGELVGVNLLLKFND